MELEKLIGNTPMIEIKYKYKEEEKTIHAKLEYYNFTGSIKDRIAYEILKRAKETGKLKEKMPIIEATSGNTGISLAAIGTFYKHPVHIFMPDWVSKERRKILEMYGATVHLVSKKEGGFKEAIKRADEYAKEINGFRPDQFNNIENIETHYKQTAEEILEQYPQVDSFVSGIGTGGTLIGVAKKLKERKNTQIYALEPAELAILTHGKIQNTHRIEGIGDEFIPSIVENNKEIIDKIITINDEDAINMSKKLSKELGLGVGISSGANFLAAVLLNETGNIVTIFPDDNKKYISTDLYGEISTNKNLISNQIIL